MAERAARDPSKDLWEGSAFAPSHGRSVRGLEAGVTAYLLYNGSATYVYQRA